MIIIASSNSCYWLTVYDKVSEFCIFHGNLHSLIRRKQKIRTLLQSETGSDFSCLVGAGGFEPPKLKAADLQSVPIGHSGTRPYLFSQSRGLPVYVTTESAVCQPIIWAARKKYIAITKALPSGCALQHPGGRAFQPDKKSGEDHFWFFM